MGGLRGGLGALVLPLLFCIESQYFAIQFEWRFSTFLLVVENQYRPMVLLLRNPAFLIVAEGGGGGAQLNRCSDYEKPDMQVCDSFRDVLQHWGFLNLQVLQMQCLARPAFSAATRSLSCCWARWLSSQYAWPDPCFDLNPKP